MKWVLSSLRNTYKGGISSFNHRGPDSGPFDPKLKALTTRPRIHKRILLQILFNGETFLWHTQGGLEY